MKHDTESLSESNAAQVKILEKTTVGQRKHIYITLYLVLI